MSGDQDRKTLIVTGTTSGMRSAGSGTSAPSRVPPPAGPWMGRVCARSYGTGEASAAATAAL
jgi:hypothetical protein